jgi:hypothetical protein
MLQSRKKLSRYTNKNMEITRAVSNGIVRQMQIKYKLRDLWIEPSLSLPVDQDKVRRLYYARLKAPIPA